MSVEGNISKLYIIRCAKWFMLYMPIIGLFYADNGLSASQLFLVQAAYSFSSAVFAIPSGYFADVLGRKKTLIIGTILGAVGFLIYAQFHSFWAFFIAEAIMGIGESCISGTDSAMLYDSLLQSQNQQKYLKYEGRVTSFGCFAETFAELCGSAIASMFSPNLPAPFIPIATAKYQTPNIKAIILAGTNLLTYDKPTGDMHNSPIV